MQQTSTITPHKGLLDVDIKGLWAYRDLFRMYVKRDIITVYKQTILGPLWYLIQPIFTTIMYMFVFGGLAGISTDGVPQPLFYMAGITLWGYFSTCFNACNCIFAVNANIFGKVYFPRLIVPLAAITTCLIKMSIQFVVFVAVYIYLIATGGFHLGITSAFPGMTDLVGAPLTLLFALLLVAMAGLHAFSWGLIVSSLTTKYRDLNFFISFAVQLFMYATPIIYPLSTAPEKYRQIISLNPLTPIFESFKHILLGCGSIDWTGLSLSAIILIITLFLSIIIFSHIERRFMDTV